MYLKKKIAPQAQSFLEAEAVQQKINLPVKSEVVVEAASKVMIMELPEDE